jgi:hypothetical protein
MPPVKCPSRVGEILRHEVDFFSTRPGSSRSAANTQPSITVVISIVPVPTDPYKWILVNPVTLAELEAADVDHAVCMPCGSHLCDFVVVQLHDRFGNVINLESLSGDADPGDSGSKRKAGALQARLLPCVTIERSGHVSSDHVHAASGARGCRLEVTDFDYTTNPSVIRPEGAVMQGMAGVWDVTVRTCENSDGADEGDGESNARRRRSRTGASEVRDRGDGIATRILAFKAHVRVQPGKPEFLQVEVQADAHAATQTFGGTCAASTHEEGAAGLEGIPKISEVSRIAVCAVDRWGNVLCCDHDSKKALEGKGVTVSVDGATIENAAQIRKAFFKGGCKNLVEFKNVRISAVDAVSGQKPQNASSTVNDCMMTVKSSISGVAYVKIPIRFAASNAVTGIECSPDPYQARFRVGQLLNKVLIKLCTEDGVPLSSHLAVQNTRVLCLADRHGVYEDGVFQVPHDQGSARPNEFVAW